MRHEWKHIINHADYLDLHSRLSRLFSHDIHAGAHGQYHVRSLYFDDPSDKALRDKINGVNRREKFRIRLYDGNTSFIRLEKKSKVNGLCAKRSVAVTAGQVRRLLAGDFAWMTESSEPLLLELYSKLQGQLLRPKVIVEYLREPFVFAPGNVRITIDRDICTGMNAAEFLEPAPVLLNTFEHYGILELKYDAFLPDIVRDAVHLRDRRPVAYSKYAAARKYG